MNATATPAAVANADRHVSIFDTSLRDGEQSPGCSMTASQKLRFAQALADLGVNVIETGFPASSASDIEATRAIVGQVRTPTLAALARCHAADIHACARALAGPHRPRTPHGRTACRESVGPDG